MTDLKTLKDLEWSDERITEDMQQRLKLLEIPIEQRQPPPKKGKHIDSLEARQEAIKHIKDLKKSDNRDHSTCYPGSECGWCLGDSFKVDWIKHFFNISESELK